MADEPITDQQWERYLRQQMNAPELEAMDRRLESDPEAQRQLARRRRSGADPPADLGDIEALFQRVGVESVHLPSGLLQRFVDQQDLAVAERDRVETHLAACTRCRQDVEDLRALRATLDAAALPTPNAAPTPRRLFSWMIPTAVAMNACAITLIWFGLKGGYDVALDRRQVAMDRQVTAAQQQAQVDIAQARQRQDAERQRAERERQIRLAAQNRATRLENALRTRPTPMPVPQTTGYQVAQLRPEEAATLERSALTNTLPPALSDGTSIRGTRLRGPAPAAPGTFGALSPVRTLVVSPRPTLRWNTHPDARSYQVILYQGARLQERANALVGETRRVAHPLARGQEYRWLLTAYDAAGQALARSEGVFVVASERVARRAAESAIRLALLEVASGLYDAAQERLLAAQEAAPGTTEAQRAGRLLADLERRRKNGSPVP